MRLFLLSALTMTAFAANSVLNRVAVDSGAIDPGSFAVIRVLAGAAILAALVLARGGALPLLDVRRLLGSGSLTLYLIGFSAAYLTLDAGLGALILFGVVQITIFVLASLRGASPGGRQITGAGIAFAGLGWVLWPAGDLDADPVGVVCMAAAGVGWALYTLAGRGEPDALSGTAANFCMAVPPVLLISLLLPGTVLLSLPGVILAILSGAVTSGLGYALWYAIVGRFSPAGAAIVQLVVPVIALIAGVLLLGEAASLRLVLGAALVLGGIALSLRAPAK